ncbi:MAG TPA: hypothetical protein PLZ64_01290 [Chitinophagales bacterium]|nr:hypothetical protein [Chitinophagales bacterium]
MKNKTVIEEELRELSPLLLLYKRQIPLPIVPEAYFSEVATTFFSEKLKENTIQQFILKDKPIVPNDYFEGFEQQVMHKIAKEEKAIKSGEVLALYPKDRKQMVLFRILAIAAVLAGVVLLINGVQAPTLPQKNCSDGVACLSQDEIYHYMNTHSNEFSMQEIKEAVAPALERQNSPSEKEKNSDLDIEIM